MKSNYLFLILAGLLISGASNAQEVLFLDTHEDPNTGTGFTTPIFSANPLEAGKSYQLTFEGAFSLTSALDWATPTPCGALEPSATFPSPAGEMDGPAGMDAVYFFAAPSAFCPLPLPLAIPNTTISLDNGGSFIPPAAVLPPYNPGHVYSFVITGQGMNAAFRYSDVPTANNYGQIRITIEPLNEIPTLSEWMLLFFALILLSIGLASFRIYYNSNKNLIGISKT